MDADDDDPVDVVAPAAAEDDNDANWRDNNSCPYSCPGSIIIWSRITLGWYDTDWVIDGIFVVLGLCCIEYILDGSMDRYIISAKHRSIE